MTYQFWRLCEAGPDNLGLACTDDGLLLGQTPLIDQRDGRFVVRERNEIEQLFKRAYGGQPSVDRLVSGLATVASALNANDPCLARIAAVHLKIPDLPNRAARDALAAEDWLIKYVRVGGGGVDWNPTLHPRTGAPPNPGWFAPTGGESGDTSAVRVAENHDDSHRTDAVPTADEEWVKLPPGKYIDELADFVEWIANAKPEDRDTLRSEIKRYYYDAGDTQGGDALNAAVSRATDPDISIEDRQALADWVSHYAHTDPAKVGQFLEQLYAPVLLLFPWLVGRALPELSRVPLETEAGTGLAQVELSAEERAAIWKLAPWPRGKVIDKIFRRGSLHELSRTIDDFVVGNAISNKSVDLNAATYQKSRILLSRMNKCLDELKEYPGTEWGGDIIKPSEITRRMLRLVIPRGSMTPAQREAIEAARARALSKGLGFTVIEF